jgi:hypothetical protein
MNSQAANRIKLALQSEVKVRRFLKWKGFSFLRDLFSYHPKWNDNEISLITLFGKTARHRQITGPGLTFPTP